MKHQYHIVFIYRDNRTTQKPHHGRLIQNDEREKRRLNTVEYVSGF